MHFVCFCRIVCVKKFTKMNTGNKQNMSLSGKSIFTFLVLLGASTYLLSNGVSTASQPNDNELLPHFTTGAVAGEDKASLVGKVPYRVTFDSKQLVGPMESYTWNFGDGEMAQGPVASHVFISEGTYAVTLTARAKTGQVHEEQVTVNVTSKQ
jgi:PKD repeat protein